MAHRAYLQPGDSLCPGSPAATTLLHPIPQHPHCSSSPSSSSLLLQRNGGDHFQKHSYTSVSFSHLFSFARSCLLLLPPAHSHSPPAPPTWAIALVQLPPVTAPRHQLTGRWLSWKSQCHKAVPVFFFFQSSFPLYQLSQQKEEHHTLVKHAMK